MSENELAWWCEALNLVPAEWRADFAGFIEEGEASDEFFAFVEGNSKCRRACEMAFRADRLAARLVNAACEGNEQDEAGSLHPIRGEENIAEIQ